MKRLSLLMLSSCLLWSCDRHPLYVPEPLAVIDQEKVELHYDQTHAYGLTRDGNPTDPVSFTWSSSNPFAATIDAMGILRGAHLGNTDIAGVSKLNGQVVRSQVTVTPSSMLYADPILDFGYVSNWVAIHEKRQRVYYGDDKWIYLGENPGVEKIEYYLYQGATMLYVVVWLDNTPSIAQEFNIFINERYKYLGKRADGALLYSDLKKVDVSVRVESQDKLTVKYDLHPN